MKFNSKSLSDTKSLAKMFKNNIYSFSNILISWEMWSGKTHFIQFLLKELWVKEKIKSPTYTLANHYKSPIWNIWHYDVYRIDENQDFLDIEEHFISNDLVIVEWAEKLKSKPDNRIEIKISPWKTPNSNRIFDFKFFWTSLSTIQINKLFKKYNTPKHVLRHIYLVTHVADRISKNLIENWILIDSKLVHCWAMLHDVIRYIDFKWWIQKDRIPYNVSDIEIKNWEKICKMYKWFHHADAAWEILEQMWYLEIWKVIRAHKSRQILDSLNTIEEKIVYYADKKVLHDKEVNIKERLIDWNKRYGEEGKKGYWKVLYKELMKLEKELSVY